MARKPEIFLRDLDPEEVWRLVKVARTSRDRVRIRHAGMALASMQGGSVPQIAVMFAAKEQTVRELTRRSTIGGSRRWTQKHAVGR